MCEHVSNTKLVTGLIDCHEVSIIVYIYIPAAREYLSKTECGSRFGKLEKPWPTTFKISRWDH